MKATKLGAVVLVLAVLGFWSWTMNRKKKPVQAPSVATKVVDPQARKILEKAETATARTKVFQYNASYMRKGSGKTSTGLVRVDRDKNWTHVSITQANGWFLRKRYESATDGETVFLVGHSEKDFVHGSYPERAYLLQRGAELVMSEFGTDAPFDSELKGLARYEGKAEAGGVNCDVVYVEYETPGEHARWYFGPDGLPRKVERLFNMYKGIPEDQKVVKTLTLTDLDVHPTFVVDDFRLQRPEGYEDVELKPRESLLAADVPAPNWKLKTPAGDTIDLSQLRGNVVVMDFWATWCGPCKMAMPGIQKVHEHFRDRPVKVVGVNCMEIDGDPAKYMKDNHFTYTLLLDGDQVAEAYHVGGIPTFYVVDQQGRVAFSSVGAGSEDQLTEIIEKLLTNGAVAKQEQGS